MSMSRVSTWSQPANCFVAFILTIVTSIAHFTGVDATTFPTSEFPPITPQSIVGGATILVCPRAHTIHTSVADFGPRDASSRLWAFELIQAANFAIELVRSVAAVVITVAAPRRRHAVTVTATQDRPETVARLNTISQTDMRLPIDNSFPWTTLPIGGFYLERQNVVWREKVVKSVTRTLNIYAFLFTGKTMLSASALVLTVCTVVVAVAEL